MSPRRRPDDDDEEEEGDLSAIIRFVPDPPLSPEVVDAFARKKQREASVKAANKMYEPILESYREYAKTLVFIPWTDR
jgi:hypothetical protein